MFDWIRQNDDVLIALGIFSLACFVLSLVMIPAVIVRIPTDYFAHRRRTPEEPAHPLRRLAVLVVKNTLGGLLILAGLAMLVLPGQGILTILIGLFVMDFPGKYSLEKRLVRQPPVWRAINWIRRKANKPPLRMS